MIRYALFGAALQAMTLMSPVHAQSVVEDPGYCAEFYPNANCRNLGASNPYGDGGPYRRDAKIFQQKIRMFQFPEAEEVIPIPLPGESMTVP
jgi:hypothetical protein